MKTTDRHIRPPHIAVFCSAADGLPRQWIETASALGRWIGRHGAVLVYGGVEAGLMKTVAEAAKPAGARIVGIVPARRRTAASPLNDIVIPATDLNNRKAAMSHLSDVFVILPGGYGTLDELMTAFAYINFTDQQSKRIILYNPDGLYDGIIAQLDKFVSAGLMRPRCLDCLTAVTTTDSLLTQLEQDLKLNPI